MTLLSLLPELFFLLGQSSTLLDQIFPEASFIGPCSHSQLNRKLLSQLCELGPCDLISETARSAVSLWDNNPSTHTGSLLEALNLPAPAPEMRPCQVGND